MSTTLPEGFTKRPPTMADLTAVTAMRIAYDMVEQGELPTSEDDVRNAWKRPGFSLVEDAQIILNAEQQVIGYAEVWVRNQHERFVGDSYTHPTYYDTGIDDVLLQFIEGRAQQLADAAPKEKRILLQHYSNGASEREQSLFERHSFYVARYTWQMEVTFTEPPSAPQWPTGITLRTAVTGQDDEKIYNLTTAAFQDIGGYTPWGLEGWKHYNMERDNFDPNLWFLAFEGEELLGAAVCFDEKDMGWLHQLAVKREGRKRGLGIALLYHVFTVFYEMGRPRIGLQVESSNASGALRLYEKVGMVQTAQFNLQEKVLQEGTTDLS